MRPDGDFVAGLTAAVLVILAIIGAIVFTTANNRQMQLDELKQCHSVGKEVRYHETAAAIYSECE